MLDHHPGSVVTFLRNIPRSPRATGAIFPSGAILAKSMVKHVDPSRDGITIELGPGTGVFTKALLDRGVKPENLLLIECIDEFVDYLRRRFPEVTVLKASAFDVEKICAERGISNVNGILSGLPLLNFNPQERESLLLQCERLLAPGAKISQLTYAQKPPLVPSEGLRVKLCKRVWLNVPPATVWLYEPTEDKASPTGKEKAQAPGNAATAGEASLGSDEEKYAGVA